MTYSYHTKSKWEVQLPAGLLKKKAYVQKYQDIRLAYINVIKQYRHFTHPPKAINLAVMI